MSSPPPIVLVTGLTSFVGSHIVLALLQNGYRVRGTVRKDEEVEDQMQRNRHNFPLLEVVKVADIASDDLGIILKGVSGVIHVASPTPNAGPAGQVYFHKAVSGTLNVLKQCLGTSVTKVVVTSSLSNMLPSFDALFDWGGVSCTANGSSLSSSGGVLLIAPLDWCPAPTKLESEDDNPQKQYIISKILAERALWKFHERHPELDVAVVHAPFVYGPYASEFMQPTPEKIGSNVFLYQLSHATPETPFPPQIIPSYADARDVAKVHILALEKRLNNNDPLQERRYLMNAGNMIYKEVLELLAQERPALKPRLVDVHKAPALPSPLPIIDTSHVEKQLGFVKYIPWRQTVLETFDAFEAMYE